MGELVGNHDSRVCKGKNAKGIVHVAAVGGIELITGVSVGRKAGDVPGRHNIVFSVLNAFAGT